MKEKDINHAIYLIQLAYLIMDGGNKWVRDTATLKINGDEYDPFTLDSAIEFAFGTLDDKYLLTHLHIAKWALDGAMLKHKGFWDFSSTYEWNMLPARMFIDVEELMNSAIEILASIKDWGGSDVPLANHLYIRRMADDCYSNAYGEYR